MAGIRHNIIFSVMAHSILLAAALLVGGSSEIRKAHLITVSLFDEEVTSAPGKEAAVARQEQIAKPRVTAKDPGKTETKSPSAPEITARQNLTPLTPANPRSDTDSSSAPGMTGIQTQNSSVQSGGGSPSSVGSQTSRSGIGDASAASASQRQKGQTTDALLKQRIRDALQANLIYPYIARKRRLEGTVLMEFRLNDRGIPEGIRVAKGSNYAVLDEAARETVLKTAPFPAKDTSIEVPIRFSLTGD